jgi:hypothetical protein
LYNNPYSEINLKISVMKKTILLSVFLSGLLTVQLSASTFRVNNKLSDNASAKIYTTLQKAHDAAYNGDTLMIDGSSLSYNDVFYCTKRLVIKGPGYFLDENPGISANKLSAKIGNTLYFQNGSAGSIILGIEFSNSYLYIQDDNITIRRCNLYEIYLYSSENITISECYLPSIYNALFGSGVITNFIVANNIINGSVSIPAGSTGVFLNNIFTKASISIPTGFDMKNNILFFTTKDNVSLPMMPDPDVSYNLSLTDHFGTDNHNKANVAEGSLFLGPLSESTDGTWQLNAGSPAIGAGEGGINCGAFGGPQPYILCGVPTGPVIYQLNVSSYSTTDNKLPVTIKVKSY